MSAFELDAELERISALAADLRNELAGIITTASGDVPDDEHDVEGSSIGFERERVRSLLDATLRRRQAIVSALARGEREGAVRCDVCGKRIGEERLAALPGVTTCVACATAEAATRNRQLSPFPPSE